jgi:hypothetical protein
MEVPLLKKDYHEQSSTRLRRGQVAASEKAQFDGYKNDDVKLVLFVVCSVLTFGIVYLVGFVFFLVFAVLHVYITACIEFSSPDGSCGYTYVSSM